MKQSRAVVLRRCDPNIDRRAAQCADEPPVRARGDAIEDPARRASAAVAVAGSWARATSTTEDTSASTRRMSPAGSSASSVGQAAASAGTRPSTMSQARPRETGLTMVTSRAAGRSATGTAGTVFEGGGVNDRGRGGGGTHVGILSTCRARCQRAHQAPCVCDDLAETSHPCDRRSQTMQRRNIAPRSHETQ